MIGDVKIHKSTCKRCEMYFSIFILKSLSTWDLTYLSTKNVWSKVSNKSIRFIIIYDGMVKLYVFWWLPDEFFKKQLSFHGLYGSKWNQHIAGVWMTSVLHPSTNLLGWSIEISKCHDKHVTPLMCPFVITIITIKSYHTPVYQQEKTTRILAASIS